MSTKYAIVNAVGRQFRVQEGDTIRANLLQGAVGSEVTLDDVVFYNNGSEVRVGSPLVQGVKVKAIIEGQERSKKVIVFKYRQKNKYKRHKSHRQDYTMLKINSIEG